MGSAGAVDNFSERIRDKRTAPKLELVLLSYAVGDGDIDAVRDRVASLGRFPSGMIALRFFRLSGFPADRGRIKKHLGPRKRRQARRLRKPLVPADQHGDLRVTGIKHLKTQHSRYKIK